MMNQWKTLAPLCAPRSHTPTIAWNGKLYCFGGGGPSFTSLCETQVYDPRSGQWQQKTPMPTPRSGSAYALLDDKIYVIGGMHKPESGAFYFLDKVEVYDPARDSWSDAPPMQHLHDYPAHVVLDGYIYVLGGHHPEATKGGPKTDPGFEVCERWKPGMDAWEEVAPLLTPRFALSAVVHEGQILTAGGVAFTPEGFLNFDHFEIYDPASNQWSRSDDLCLPYKTAGQGLIMASDSRMYLFGGYQGDGIGATASVYDFQTKQWQSLPDMPSTMAAMGLAELDGHLYLTGGWPDYQRIPSDRVMAWKL